MSCVVIAKRINEMVFDGHCYDRSILSDAVEGSVARIIIQIRIIIERGEQHAIKAHIIARVAAFARQVCGISIAI